MAIYRLAPQPVAAREPGFDAALRIVQTSPVRDLVSSPNEAIAASAYARQVPSSAITDAAAAAITAQAAASPAGSAGAQAPHVAPAGAHGVPADRIAVPLPSGVPLSPAPPGPAATPGQVLARLDPLGPPAPAGTAPAQAPAGLPDAALSAVASEDAQQCLMATPAPSAAPTPQPGLASDAFGEAIAAAALQQTRDFVVYTDEYRSISFPMGDVPPLFGVCTDVVVRAFRAVGIDLQARVYAARVGSRDPNIAHRRTATLRRYFTARGASLPVSTFAEDFLPGDIVTYTRPGNRGSQDHIAVVSAIRSASGRPMIVHNRGWGPQLEDALFADQITGHYRYRQKSGPEAVLEAGPGARVPVLRPAKYRRQITRPVARARSGPGRGADGS